ncbi:5-deoxy-glucuronate isomerase [Streptomyces lavendulae]|uniref:5-deoxy-glucuronate isomerase n=1 Tax=Streptomyces lavendulae TaxID=1914 RepID=UPI0033CD3A60
MPVVSESAMEFTRLRVLELAPGETYGFACGDAEWIVLPLAGGCEVRYAEASPGPDGRPGAAPARHPGPAREGSPGLDPGTAPDPEPDPEPFPDGSSGLGPGVDPDPEPDPEPFPDGSSGPDPGVDPDPEPDPEPFPDQVSGGPGRGAAGGPQVFRLDGRGGVFDGPSDFAYLPRDGRAEVSSARGGRFALAGARCERRLPARYGPAGAVPVELRGAGTCSRQVHNFAAADVFPCDRLIAVEVLTPGGNWSSYPPHKHDERHPGEESRLEEIYFFEIAPHDGVPGLGYQRVSPSPAGKTDVLAEVRTGDTVLIPDGWHGPSIAAPGHDMYYLNVMAGPDATREWLIRDHPDHGWIRGTWPGLAVDPRLPFPRAEDPA